MEMDFKPMISEPRPIRFNGSLPLRFEKNTRSKYHNKKTVIDGITFASTKEAQYYCELKLKIRAGMVVRFDRQVKYPVIANGARICAYFADFVVYYPDGKTEIIDVKGMRTDVYKLKKRLVEAIYCVKIKEV